MTHNSFSYICLLHFSTCFDQPSAHHQESQLYQYDLWYMSLYVGDRVVYVTLVILCVLLSVYVYLLYYVCIVVFTLDAGLLA